MISPYSSKRKQISFADVAGSSFDGRWFEELSEARGQCRRTRFLIESVQQYPNFSMFSYSSIAWHGSRGPAWAGLCGVSGLYMFYVNQVQEFYSGPFLYEDDSLVWAFAPVRDVRHFMKVHPFGVDLANTPPMEAEDFRWLVEPLSLA